MGDVEKVEDNESQVIIPGTPQKSRKRKLIKSSKKMDKVEEKKPARWAMELAMDLDLSHINLSPHRPETPPPLLLYSSTASPHLYSSDDDNVGQLIKTSNFHHKITIINITTYLIFIFKNVKTTSEM